MMKYTLFFSIVIAFQSSLSFAQDTHIQNTDVQNTGAQNPQVKVMTRNLYLGADFVKVATAQSTPWRVPDRAATAFAAMQVNNRFERLESLADEIAQHQPHLIGLQEVMKIYRQSPASANPVDDKDLVFDFLPDLMKALNHKLKNKLGDRGVSYKVAGASFAGGFEVAMSGAMSVKDTSNDDLRLEFFNTILLRNDVELSAITEGRYQAVLKAPFSGDDIEPSRGYIIADVIVNGYAYRFANTHLEVGWNNKFFGLFFNRYQRNQMKQLLAILENDDKPVILLGDINSGPLRSNSSVYHMAIDAGFTDVWAHFNPQSPGFTCCFDKDINKPDDVFSSRVDHIFFRPPASSRTGHDFSGSAEIIGNNPQVISTYGLWPSDHGGIVADFIGGFK